MPSKKCCASCKHWNASVWQRNTIKKNADHAAYTAARCNAAATNITLKNQDQTAWARLTNYGEELLQDTGYAEDGDEGPDLTTQLITTGNHLCSMYERRTSQ